MAAPVAKIERRSGDERRQEHVCTSVRDLARQIFRDLVSQQPYEGVPTEDVANEAIDKALSFEKVLRERNQY